MPMPMGANKCNVETWTFANAIGITHTKHGATQASLSVGLSFSMGVCKREGVGHCGDAQPHHGLELVRKGYEELDL